MHASDSLNNLYSTGELWLTRFRSSLLLYFEHPKSAKQSVLRHDGAVNIDYNDYKVFLILSLFQKGLLCIYLRYWYILWHLYFLCCAFRVWARALSFLIGWLRNLSYHYSYPSFPTPKINKNKRPIRQIMQL